MLQVALTVSSKTSRSSPQHVMIMSTVGTSSGRSHERLSCGRFGWRNAMLLRSTGSCVGATMYIRSISIQSQIRSRVYVRTKYEKLDSQEKPGKAQSVGGLNRLLSNYKAVYAVSKIGCKGQHTQHCRRRHEHPGMIVKRHVGEAGLWRDQLVCVEAV